MEQSSQLIIVDDLEFVLKTILESPEKINQIDDLLSRSVNDYLFRIELLGWIHIDDHALEILSKGKDALANPEQLKKTVAKWLYSPEIDFPSIATNTSDYGWILTLVNLVPTGERIWSGGLLSTHTSAVRAFLRCLPLHEEHKAALRRYLTFLSRLLEETKQKGSLGKRPRIQYGDSELITALKKILFLKERGVDRMCREPGSVWTVETKNILMLSDYFNRHPTEAYLSWRV